MKWRTFLNTQLKFLNQSIKIYLQSFERTFDQVHVDHENATRKEHFIVIVDERECLLT